MDDLSDDERRSKQALERLDRYEAQVTLNLAQEILKHEDQFIDSKKPLHGLAPDLLEKFYGVFNSIWTAQKAFGKGCR